MLPRFVEATEFLVKREYGVSEPSAGDAPVGKWFFFSAPCTGLVFGVTETLLIVGAFLLDVSVYQPN